MTAEVAVMNKVAVALAADSAVTSGGGKIYNSINKLFRLSDHRPVGIMIYGRAEFMGIPWESLIKMYRSQLGTGGKDSLGEYGTDFVKYLQTQHGIFPDDERDRCARDAVSSYLDELVDTAAALAETNPKDLDAEIRDAAKQFSNLVCKNCKELTGTPPDFRKELESKYGSKVEDLIKQAFAGLKITSSTEAAIKDYCFECLCREYFEDFSGVVVAGFGETDLFPSIIEYEIEGFPLGSFLKYRLKKQPQINFSTSAGIVSFAQKEMVTSFMTGVHPYVRQHLEGFLNSVFQQYEDAIIKNLSSNSTVDLADLRAKLKKSSQTILRDLNKNIKQHQQEYHISPVLNAVEMLPKDELAIMAESLVNLTVLKRRMSTDEESVGGPIDVAVISKGDGFVWIKRKHYFTKELNPRYITQYFPSHAANWPEQSL